MRGRQASSPNRRGLPLPPQYRMLLFSLRFPSSFWRLPAAGTSRLCTHDYPPLSGGGSLPLVCLAVSCITIPPVRCSCPGIRGTLFSAFGGVIRCRLATWTRVQRQPARNGLAQGLGCYTPVLRDLKRKLPDLKGLAQLGPIEC